MSKFNGRLWTQGKDGSLYPSIDIASMNASGALMRNAVERSLHLISQVRVSMSRPKRDPSISTNGLICKVEPASSSTKSDGARLEFEFSVIAETPNSSSSGCLSKHEMAVDLAADPNRRTATRAGSRQVVFGPQQSDDDLRASGELMASACNHNIGRLTNCETLSRWICRISLAADERSVSILSIFCCFAY